jgi:hypothetical protein
MRANATRHRKRTTGAASVEAALVLPVLALALFGVMFLRTYYAAGDDARRLVRRCALEFAMAGCDAERVARDCARRVSAARPEADREETRALRRSAEAGDRFGVLALPLIRDAVDGVFGTTARAHAERALARPWSRSPAQVTEDYAVVCDSAPPDLREAIARVFCDLVPVVRCR